MSDELEKKRAECDFELVWSKLSQMSFESLKEAHRYSYMQGRGAGKADAMRIALAEDYSRQIESKDSNNALVAKR